MKIKQLLNNAYSFSVIAKIVSIFTGFLYAILFARYLGPELRGTASVILNYSDLISLVLTLGMYQAYPYFKKCGKDVYMEYINNVLALWLLFTLFSVVIALTGWFSMDGNIAIILAPLIMGVKMLNYVVLIENPKLRNTASIKLDIFDIVLLTVFMMFTTANYIYCIFLLLAKQVIFFLIAFTNLRIKISDIHLTLKEAPAYIKYGIVPMITVIMMEINYRVDVVMLEAYGISKAEIGIYAIGVMLAQKLWMIPDAMRDILLSKLAKGKTEEEVAKVTRLSFAITVIMVLGMIALGKPFIKIAFGNDFADAYFITLTILAGVLGMVFYKMVYSYNVVNGHKNANLYMLMASAILNIIINALTIPYLGAFGAALASLCSCSLCGIMFLCFFTKHTIVKIKDMVVLKGKDIELIKNMTRHR